MGPQLQDVEPALLTKIGARAMHALKDAGWLERPTQARTMPEKAPEPEPAAERKHVKKIDAPPRTYASQYKGVSVNRGHYYGIWKEHGAARCGPVRPYSADGERWAAQDRARALELDYLELRDGTRVAWEVEERAA